MLSSLQKLTLVTVLSFFTTNFVHGQAGNALQFDGTNDYGGRGIMSTQTDNVTLEAWVNWGGSTGFNQFIVNNGNSGSSGYGIFIQTTGELSMINGGVAILESGYFPVVGQWFHVAIVRSSGTWRMYVNGTEEVSGVFGPATPTDMFTVGSNSFPTEFFKGQIDEVRLWQVARSESEINDAIFEPAEGGETGLVAVYHFNESSGASAGDGTSNGFNMTLINGPSFVLSAFNVGRLTAVAKNGEVEVHWPPTNTYGWKNYTVVAATDAELTEQFNAFIVTGDQNDTTRTFSSLNNGTIYYFGVFVTDSSDGTSEAVINAAVPNDGGPGNALNFDGVDDRVAVSSSINSHFSTNHITVEAWVNLSDGFNYDNAPIVTEAYQGDDKVTFALYLIGQPGSGTIRAGFYSPGWTEVLATMPSAGWNHVAATYDQSSLDIYVNGELVASSNVSLALPAGTEEWRIGQRWDAPLYPNYFSGQIDELRIWNIARSQSDIQSSAFQPLRGDEPGLVALYHFDEPATSTTAYSSTTSDYAGTLSGFTTDFTSSGSMVPFPPANLTASAGFEQVELNWTASSTADIYYIFQFDGEGYALIDSTTDVFYIVGSLANYTTYDFAVTAVDPDGKESSQSYVSATPSSMVEVNAGLTGVTNGNIAWGDYDNDGDLDILLTGSTNGDFDGGISSIFRNDEGTFTDINAGLAGGIYRSSAQWGDYDNDGYLDIIHTGSSGNGTRTLKLYHNNGNGTFTDVAHNLTPVAKSSVAWADFDNDGDLDVLIMGEPGTNFSDGEAALYRNDGSGNFDKLTSTGLPMIQDGQAAWGDFDNDGFQDLLLVGSQYGYTDSKMAAVFRNNGDGTFSDIELGLDGANRSSAAWGDFDNDGDLDFAYTGAAGGQPATRVFKIYRNNGEGFSEYTNHEITAVFAASIAWGDHNNDGYLDLLVTGSPDNANTAQTYVYEYDSESGFEESPVEITGVMGYSSSGSRSNGSAAWGDYDNDGRLDVLVSGYDPAAGEFVTKLYRNLTESLNELPSTPTNLSTFQDGGPVQLSWDASDDNGETPDEGLSYNVRIGSSPGASDILSAHSDPSSGFRRVPALGNAGGRTFYNYDGPDGTLYWSVQAVDQSLAGSEFSTENSFVYDGAPSAPGNLTVTDEGTSLILKWGARNKSDVKEYRIFVGSTPNPTEVLATNTGGLTDTSFVYVGATVGLNYYFRVVAEDNLGQVGDTSTSVYGVVTPLHSVATLPGISEGAAVWGDYDNDGDLDILISGSTNSYSTEVATSLYRNDGGTFTKSNQLFDGGAYRGGGAFVDFDNDGDLDISYLGAAGNGTRLFKMYRNNGNGTFTEVQHSVEGLALSSMSWADFDNDGDMDLVMMGNSFGGNQVVTRLYRNDGQAGLQQVDGGVNGKERGMFAWGDYDNDGDQDLLQIGQGEGNEIGLYTNELNGNFSLNLGFLAPGAVNGACAFADIDNDGFLDIIYTGATGGGGRIFGVWRNNGDGSFTDLESSLPGLSKAILTIADFDNDGDVDFFVSGESSDGGGESGFPYAFYGVNDGTGHFVEGDLRITAVTGDYKGYASGGFGDYDNDGDLDLMVSGEDDNGDYLTIVYQNTGNEANALPTAPTGLTTFAGNDTLFFIWNEASDDETPEEGLTYNIRVGTTPGGMDVMSPHSAADGRRLIPGAGNAGSGSTWNLANIPDGTYYWSVQTIDQGLRGSAFATEPEPVTIDRAPSAPIDVIAYSGDTSATIVWSLDNVSDVAWYYIYDVSDGSFLVDSAMGISNQKLIFGLQNGNTYDFRVVAVDGGGRTSPESETVSVIPSATPGKWFVTSVSDYGPGSLDEAIGFANQVSQPDTIVFLLPPGSVILLDTVGSVSQITSDYTYINGDVNGDGIPDITINGNGSSQSGFYLASDHNTIKNMIIVGFAGGEGTGSGIDISSGASSNLILGNRIGTDGYIAQPNSYGVHIEDGSYNSIGDGTIEGRNLISGNYQDNIRVYGNEALYNTISGNYIGVDSAGLNGLGNAYNGISLYTGSQSTTVGGTTAAARNVISGNMNYGIYMYSSHYNSIIGNYIGTDASGTVAVPNGGEGGSGIYLERNSSYNRIGNGTTNGRNVISGNYGYGVGFGGSYAVYGNRIIGNYIGVDGSGAVALGNSSNGVYMGGSDHNNNWIGDATTGGRNVISGNGSHGVYMDGYEYQNKIVGNYIGTNAAGTDAIPNDGSGVYLSNYTYENEIGNKQAQGKNVVSGNNGDGIYIAYNSNYNRVRGNYVGTNATGTSAIANQGSGIVLWNAGFNAIGDGTAQGKNVVSGNSGAGIEIYGGDICEGECEGGNIYGHNKVWFNYVGVAADGETALGNVEHGIEVETLGSDGLQHDSILSNIVAFNGGNGILIEGFNISQEIIHYNSIYSNDGSGIVIDEGEGEGSNLPQQGVTPPRITSITATTVSGNSAPNAFIQVYADEAEEGRYFITSTTANESGEWSAPISITPGLYVKALQDSAGNTSAFSTDEFTAQSGTLATLPATFDFGTVLVGDSVSMPAKLYSTGGVVTLAGAELLAGGINFRAEGEEPVGDLGAGDTISGVFWFKPTTFGPLHDTVSIFNTGGSFFVPLSGVGGAGTLAATATSVNFGDVLIGDSAVVATQVYTTVGSVELTSASFQNGGAFTFALSDELPVILTPGDTLLVTTKYKPQSATMALDTLNLANNSAVNPLRIRYSGTGLAGSLTASQFNVNFGSVFNGDSAQATFRVYAQTGEVLISDYSTATGGRFSYQFDHSLPFTAKAGDTLSVMVKFKPDVSMNFTDTISLINNSSVNPLRISLEGSGMAGNVGANIMGHDFGGVLVGDSASVDLKLYTTAGRVRIDGWSGLNTGEMHAQFDQSLPYTITEADTLTIKITYAPTIFSSIADTIRIFKEDGVISGPFAGTGLVGTLAANRASVSFGSIRVADSSAAEIVKIYTTVGRVPLTSISVGSVFSSTASLSLPRTLMPGDTLVVSSKFKPTAVGAVTDTLRVGTVKVAYAGTGLENIPPVLTLGVLSLKTLSQYLGIYMHASEALANRTSTFRFNSVIDASAPTFAPVSGNPNVYFAQYELTAAGTLNIQVTGTDAAGNVGNRSKDYTVTALSKLEAFNLAVENIELSGGRKSFDGDGFVIVSDVPLNSVEQEALGKIKGDAPTILHNQSALTPLGNGIELVATVAIKEPWQLRMAYNDESLNDLRSRFIDFDERKIGIYRLEEGAWISVGGEGMTGTVTARILKPGIYAAVYNDTYVAVPTSLELSQNFPNPFNPSTTIRFGLPETGKVRLVVYNVLGQAVKELIDDRREAGHHEVVWNGRNSAGQQVSSGIYLYRLETAKGVVTRKMMLLK